MKGSKQPLSLYTVSVQTESIFEIKDRFKNLSKKETKSIRVIEKKKILQGIFFGSISVSDLIHMDEDF